MADDHYDEWARSQELKGRTVPVTTAPYYPPSILQGTEVGRQVRDMYAQTEMRLAIDADCPGCGWPERWFNGDKFGCNKCEYTSSNRNS